MKKTDLQWAKNYSKNHDLSLKYFTFKKLGISVQGKFSEPHTLGFVVIALDTEKIIGTVYGAESKEQLEQQLNKVFRD